MIMGVVATVPIGAKSFSMSYPALGLRLMPVSIIPSV